LVQGFGALVSEAESSNGHAAAPDSDGDGEEAAAAGERPRAGRRAMSWFIALAVTAVAGGVLAFVCLPGQRGRSLMLGAVGGVYGVLAVGTCLWLWRRGELSQRLRPRSGDITIGAILAVGMYMLATVVHLGLSGRGTPREQWLRSIYWQLGDPIIISTFMVGVTVLPRTGWLLCTALYAVAHLPTVFLLGDPIAGPNPMLLIAAVGGGLVWGYLATRLGRLTPSVFAHALFSWGVIEIPLWRM